MNSQVEGLLRGVAFSRAMDAALGHIRKKYDMKKVTIEVLYFLKNYPEYDTPSAVADNMMLTRGHVSQAIDALLRNGFIVGVVDEKDRRSTHYHVTDAAEDVVKDIVDGREQIEKALLDGIPEEDMAVVHRVLPKLYENVEKITRNGVEIE